MEDGQGGGEMVSGAGGGVVEEAHVVEDDGETRREVGTVCERVKVQVA